jgi:hypothetical protein
MAKSCEKGRNAKTFSKSERWAKLSEKMKDGKLRRERQRRQNHTRKEKDKALSKSEGWAKLS